jgi:hypothetical protein
MWVTSMSSPSGTVGPTRHAGRYRVTRWVLIVIGGIAAFLGLFIMFGSENQSVGVGAEASWKVSEIPPAWGYSLLAVGLVLLVGGLVLTVRNRRLPVTDRAEGSGWNDVLAHAGVFLVVNAFLWIQDIAIGGGLDYAYWITIPWAIGLAAHAIAQGLGGRGRTVGA